MTTKRICTKAALAAAAFGAALFVQGDVADMIENGNVTAPAEAVIGRPLTPGSVAGVARRTTRRTIRRSAIYVASLPRGCATVSINGVAMWQCGATYYQASGTQYVVVYVD